MDFEQWFSLGIEKGWLGDPYCYVHDSPELTPEEEELIEAEDGDWDAICIGVARLFPGGPPEESNVVDLRP